MLLELKLAFRFLRGTGGFVRLTTAAAVAGIALGVAGFIIVKAAGRGFRDELNRGLLAGFPHIVVFDQTGGRLDQPEKLVRSIGGSENIISISPEAHAPAAVTSPLATRYAEITASPENGLGPQHAVLGKELAKAVGVQPGDTIELTLIAAGGRVETGRFTIENVSHTGIFQEDETLVEISPAEFARLSGGSFMPTLLNIKLADPFRAAETAATIAANLSSEPLRVITWQEANQPLFAAMASEQRIASVATFLIAVVAAFNVTATLVMVAAERRHDIAVLKSVGAAPNAIRRIFLIKGLSLGAAGSAAGIATAFAACNAAEFFGLTTLPAEIYMISRINLEPFITDIFIACGAAIALSAAAALYPAAVSARVRPFEVFRRSAG